jgi:hypothetical protein
MSAISMLRGAPKGHESLTAQPCLFRYFFKFFPVSFSTAFAISALKANTLHRGER